MSTVPKITKEHMEKATNSFKWDERYSVDICNKAIEIALAEQQEGEYITAAQARELGAGNAEYSLTGDDWHTCGYGCEYARFGTFSKTEYKYRAIKQAQPEQVDPHADLRAEYIRQRDAVPCELGFYEWEYRTKENEQWRLIEALLGTFYDYYQYRCTDISCYVSKDGEPAIRMLRTEAQELQAELGDTVEWWAGTTKAINGEDFTFNLGVNTTYTYAPKATIKLDGEFMTWRAANAVHMAKYETHDLYTKIPKSNNCKDFQISSEICWKDAIVQGTEYELRPKQPAWTGSRDDVIALLKQQGLLCI